MPVKYLIVRFSSIGDIVLTTPVIRCLRNQVKGAEVHFLTKKQFLPVIEANPYVDKIHLLGNLHSTIRSLKSEKFHYIIDLHNNLRSAVIKSRLPSISFSFKKLNLEKWLLIFFNKNSLPPVHIVDRYLQTVKLFDVSNDGRGLDYFIPPENEVDLSSLPEPFRSGYILMTVGSNHQTKCLPPSKLVELCREINLPVILAGGEEDRSTGEMVSNTCGKLVMNGCGNYPLNSSASLVKQAKLVISYDTGIMHIAAAFKKRIISIWGNTVKEFGMYPYYCHPDSAMFEVKGLKCRPCSKLGYSKCPKKHFRCMEDQNIKEIADYAREIFSKA